MQTTVLVSMVLLLVVTVTPLHHTTQELHPYPWVQYDEPDISVYSEENELSHDRSKRQTSVSAGVNVEHLPHDIRKESANLNLEHSINRHTLNAGINYQRARIPGFPSQKNVGANIGYEFRPNKDTSFSLNAEHSRGSGGRSNSFGARFQHFF
ncbi:uncharacterized protein [Cherax quadricarinatus]|uniref:uncharacterized protein n=1 Tax=Cherax quadricarinatus TaxID=27406 RepID=UPI00387EC808